MLMHNYEGSVDALSTQAYLSKASSGIPFTSGNSPVVCDRDADQRSQARQARLFAKTSYCDL
jgi:hypothetical protein